MGNSRESLGLHSSAPYIWSSNTLFKRLSSSVLSLTFRGLLIATVESKKSPKRSSAAKQSQPEISSFMSGGSSGRHADSTIQCASMQRVTRSRVGSGNFKYVIQAVIQLRIITHFSRTAHSHC